MAEVSWDSAVDTWKNEYGGELGTDVTDESSVLTIEAFTDEDYSTAADLDKWIGFFNPSSIKEVFENEYFEDFPIGSTGGDPKFKRSTPSELSVKLMLSNSTVPDSDLSTA